MQIGMIGVGRMGANMVRRLMKAGHECVIYDPKSAAVDALVLQGAVAARSLDQLVRTLARPRVAWLMVPAAVVDPTLAELSALLEPDDIIIDGGNSYYQDDIRRAGELKAKGLHYVDVGVSGGVWGLERGYCQMIGGDPAIVQQLDPIFAALAPPHDAAVRTRGRAGPPTTAEHGHLHCGPSGAGHFVKMIHNGVEYGLMAAYAEGLNILAHANVGHRTPSKDAETAPLRHPEHYQYDFDLTEIAELWRRGSVIGSWLLDLIAAALFRSPGLDEFEGRVSDSGEGRWTVLAAIESGTPAPVLTTALFERFVSRGEAEFADRVLSALRYQFGGHVEKRTDPPSGAETRSKTELAPR